MAISMGQVSLGTTGASLICLVPPGASVTLTSTEVGGTAVADVFVGLGTATAAVLAVNGCPVSPYAPLVLHNPVSSPAFSLWGACGSDTHAVGWVVVPDR